MSLRVRKLRLAVMTTGGLYGRLLEFGDGLQVLLVDNASGKSTCVQAIVYALGLEGMLSAKHDIPLPHSMIEYLQTTDGPDLHVTESEVWLVVENRNGEQLTLRRQVKGGLDSHLITVWAGDALNRSTERSAGADYYVRMPGGATAGRGFHRFFAAFLGWSLPEVTRFDGSSCPLYLECIFPLLIIEQKRGWSGVQAAMPLHYRIRDVRKRAIEFLLDMDATRLALEREEIKQELADLKAAWSRVEDRLGEVAEEIGGVLHGFPASPIAIWPPEALPQVFIESDDALRGLASARRSVQSRLDTLEQREIPRIEEDAARLEGLLQERIDELSELSVALHSMQNDIQIEVSEKRAIEVRLREIEESLAEYADVQKLQKLGSTSVEKIERGVCPTCEQRINDTLLEQSDDFRPMTVEDNIAFLKDQRSTFEAMMASSQAEIDKRARQNRRLIDRANELRSEVRHIKSSLLSQAEAPSEAAIAERIELRQYIRRLQDAEAAQEVAYVRLADLAEGQQRLLERQAALPAGALSKDDTEKLRVLAESLREQLSAYGMRSLTTDGFGIDEGSYHPTYEEFDLGFDLAASDVIRLIWAYTIGLLEVSRSIPTNHPGMLVLDEPQQQNVKDLSISALVDRASLAAQFGQQVLLAVSKLPDQWEDGDRTRASIHRIEGWVLQPMDD